MGRGLYSMVVPMAFGPELRPRLVLRLRLRSSLVGRLQIELAVGWASRSVSGELQKS